MYAGLNNKQAGIKVEFSGGIFVFSIILNNFKAIVAVLYNVYKKLIFWHKTCKSINRLI